MYILYDEKGNYICKDTFQQYGGTHECYSITTNKGNAITFDSEEKADNIRKNCLNRNLKKMGFMVAELEPDKNAQEEKPVPVEVVLDDLSHVGSLLVDLNLKRDALFNALSVVDREISDIHHWLELEKINACQGYKASAMLREKLLRRRSIKDGIEIIQAISNVETTINNLKNRTYQPRELKELFGGDKNANEQRRPH